MKKLPVLIICIVVLLCQSCGREYRCDCQQDVSGIDTSYTLVGEGTDGDKVCDEFDSETTEFGITKTIDCEPF